MMATCAGPSAMWCKTDNPFPADLPHTLDRLPNFATLEGENAFGCLHASLKTIYVENS